MNSELWIDDKFAANILSISNPTKKQLSELGGSFTSLTFYTATLDKNISVGIGAIRKYEIRDGYKHKLIDPIKSIKVGDGSIMLFEYRP